MNQTDPEQSQHSKLVRAPGAHEEDAKTKWELRNQKFDYLLKWGAVVAVLWAIVEFGLFRWPSLRAEAEARSSMIVAVTHEASMRDAHIVKIEAQITGLSRDSRRISGYCVVVSAGKWRGNMPPSMRPINSPGDEGMVIWHNFSWTQGVIAPHAKGIAQKLGKACGKNPKFVEADGLGHVRQGALTRASATVAVPLGTEWVGYKVYVMLEDGDSDQWLRSSEVVPLNSDSPARHASTATTSAR